MKSWHIPSSLQHRLCVPARASYNTHSVLSQCSLSAHYSAHTVLTVKTQYSCEAQLREFRDGRGRSYAKCTKCMVFASRPCVSTVVSTLFAPKAIHTVDVGGRGGCAMTLYTLSELILPGMDDFETSSLLQRCPCYLRKLPACLYTCSCYLQHRST